MGEILPRIALLNEEAVQAADAIPGAAWIKASMPVSPRKCIVNQGSGTRIKKISQNFTSLIPLCILLVLCVTLERGNTTEAQRSHREHGVFIGRVKPSFLTSLLPLCFFVYSV
jgi:hypothetical protein